jgi:hypothetical protein
MPILSSAVFDDTGKPYDVSKILTPDFLFDKEAYEKYSRVYLPITYVLAYAVQFAGLSALVTHSMLAWERYLEAVEKSLKEDRDSTKTEYTQWLLLSVPHPGGDCEEQKSRIRHDSETDIDGSMGGEDVHSRLMRKYQDVPMTWYLLTSSRCWLSESSSLNSEFFPLPR